MKRSTARRYIVRKSHRVLLAENERLRAERTDFVTMLDNATNGEIKALRDVSTLQNIADAAASIITDLHAENERLRAALETLVSDLALDSDSGLIPPDQRIRFARYVRDARAALAAKKG